MAQVLTVVIQPLNYDHKFPWHGTAEGGGDDFIGQSRVAQLIKQGKKHWAAWGAAPCTCGRSQRGHVVGQQWLRPLWAAVAPPALPRPTRLRAVLVEVAEGPCVVVVVPSCADRQLRNQSAMLRCKRSEFLCQEVSQVSQRSTES